MISFALKSEIIIHFALSKPFLLFTSFMCLRALLCLNDLFSLTSKSCCPFSCDYSELSVYFSDIKICFPSFYFNSNCNFLPLFHTMVLPTQKSLCYGKVFCFEHQRLAELLNMGNEVLSKFYVSGFLSKDGKKGFCHWITAAIQVLLA